MVEHVKNAKAQGLVANFRNDDDDGPEQKLKRSDPPKNPLQPLAKQIQELKKQKAHKWTKSQVQNLTKTVKDVLSQTLAKYQAQSLMDDYAIQQAANVVRQQMREMAKVLNPPPELMEADDFQELMELLWPPGMRSKPKHQFTRGSAMRGSIKSEVKQQLIADAIKEASRRAGKKMLQQQMDQSMDLNQFARMNLEQMARQIRKMLRKKKKRGVVDENGELVLGEAEAAEEAEETRALQQMMQIFSAKALETMRSIREEVAPRWAPEQQPWLLQEADKQVFDILLAGIPLELFEETEAWGEIQDLRKGHEVFTLRAADKLTEAASRNQEP